MSWLAKPPGKAATGIPDNPEPQTPMTARLRISCFTLSLLLSAPWISTSHGQETAPLEAEGDEQDIFELSPYEVNTTEDRGWIGTNTQSATRLNTQVKDLPMGITIITSEFLEDTGAVDILESLKYVASVTIGGDKFENGSTIRGIGGAYPFRNGIKQYYTNFTANVDRVEVIRGAAAVTYGQSFPGGLINYITKKPLYDFQSSVDASIGSWSYHDLVLDVTGPLTDELAYRVVIQDHETDSWKDNQGTDRRSYNGALRYKITPNITLDMDYQNDETTWFLATGPIVNFEGDGFVDLPRENNYWGRGANMDVEVETYTFDLRVRLTPNLTSRTVFSNLHDRFSFNVYGPWRANEGNVLAGARDGPAFQHQGHDTDFYRQMFLWDVEVADMRHRIQFGFEADRELYFFHGYDYRQGGDEDQFPIQRAFNRQRVLANYPEEWSQQVIPPTPEMLGDRPDWPGYPRILPPRGGPTAYYPNWVQEVTNDTDEFFISDSISMMDDRLHVLLGLRYTEYEWTQGFEWAFGGDAYVGAGTHQIGYIDSDTEGFEEATLDLDNKTDPKNSDYLAPQIGVSYQVADWINLYALYSESLFPSSNEATRDGELMEPSNGEGTELGVKLDDPERGISATFTAFHLIEGNLPTWDPRNTGEETFQIAGGENESIGLEAEMMWQPSENWSNLFGYAYTDAEVKTDFGDLIRDPENHREGTWLGTPKHKLTLYSKYTFTEGPLENLNLRAGLVYTSESEVIRNEDVRVPVDGYTTVDLGIGYRIRIGQADWNFNLNLYNVTDEEFIAYKVKEFPQHGDPFHARFSVGVDF